VRIGRGKAGDVPEKERGKTKTAKGVERGRRKVPLRRRSEEEECFDKGKEKPRGVKKFPFRSG